LSEKDVDLPECRAVFTDILEPAYVFASKSVLKYTPFPRKHIHRSYIAVHAPGRYLQPTIAVTRTELDPCQHEHRDQDINAHLPSDMHNFLGKKIFDITPIFIFFLGIAGLLFVLFFVSFCFS
jgi:hypothetical protein